MYFVKATASFFVMMKMVNTVKIKKLVMLITR